ncbi:TRAP-type C4-dicarboxylate transport system [Gracilibacillus boraciitolerans JCM 21714]|uniref:TRAP-type C4-dicarboxylate transport system n=1 Tax=Gracilibacillus boraciitolerans JCM 21714 TaxID=1298598 RepID=W4VGB1_9BACI|nr:TRAP transporter substrate-binding protein [Gracilibacillus boraciitolerans]GAE91858.1 TRAP-type C4-dicarboxylate transport system [Gracilibacillus boraciitolerans JCM 21714]
MNKKLLFLVSMLLGLVLLLAACGGDSSEESARDTNEDQGTEDQDGGENEGSTDGGEETEESAETVTFRLADNQPEDYPTVVGDKEFARLVEEKTDGRYKIEVYAGGQLGDEVSVIEQIQLGSIDFARVNASPLTQFNDQIGVLSLPYLFESEEQKWEKLNGDVGRELLDTFDGSNMVGLAYYDSGERAFYNTQYTVTSPSDLEGMKIRVQQSDLAIAVVEALGASATPMAYEEVYSGLQTGVIDGAENNFPSYYTVNHYEVAPYYTLPGYTGTPEIVIGSQQVWDQLSDEDKELFREAAMESVEAQREAWAELTEEARTAVEEAGSEIAEVDDLSEWRDAVQPVYDEFGEQYGEWVNKLSE